MILDSVLAAGARALAALPGASRFTGSRAVARRELVSNLKSLRMAVIAGLLALAVVGGGAGISAVTGGNQDPGSQTLLFVHVVWPDGATQPAAVVVWAADPFGSPKAGVGVRIHGDMGPPGLSEVDNTGPEGFVVFRDRQPDFYHVEVAGSLSPSQPRDIVVPPVPQAFSADMQAVDIGGNGSRGDILIQVLDATGAPIEGLQLQEAGVPVATLDRHGFAHLVRGEGEYTFTVEYGGGSNAIGAHVGEAAPSLLQLGPNAVMQFVALIFIQLILPVLTIAVAHDAIARERAQGSLESLLSRPTTRSGVLLGKFVGSLAAMLVPVYGSLLAGALVIGAMAGEPIDGTFLAGILVGVTVYVAAYTLLLLIFSTLARTTGTAIMFGILIWLIYNLLWNVVTLIIQSAAGLTPSDRAYYDLAIYSNLFNLNNLYGSIVLVSFPGAHSPYTFGGQELLPSWTPFAAYAAWLIVLFVAALWVFNKRAAE